MGFEQASCDHGHDALTLRGGASAEEWGEAKSAHSEQYGLDVAVVRGGEDLKGMDGGKLLAFERTAQ